MFEVPGSWKVHVGKKFPFSLLCNTFDPCAFDFSQIFHVTGSCLDWSFRFPGIIWWWLNKHSHAGRTGLVNTGHWCGSCQWFESGRLPEAWTVQAGGLFGLCPRRNSFRISQTHTLQWGHVAHLQVCCETTSETCLYCPFHLLCLCMSEVLGPMLTQSARSPLSLESLVINRKLGCLLQKLIF